MKIKSKVRGGAVAVSATAVSVPIIKGGCNPSTRTLGPVVRPVYVLQ
jgi:hypothetical protein